MEKKTIYQKLFEVKKSNIKLQRDTKAFNYKYATLSQIQEKLSDVMEEQGLLIMHSIVDNHIETSIIDTESSDNVTSTIKLSDDMKPQNKGSEITYYRRYNLLSLLDLEVEDDDGKKAQDNKGSKEEKRYNDFEKDKEKIKKAIKEGKSVEEIVAGLKKSFKLSKKVEDDIKFLV